MYPSMPDLLSHFSAAKQGSIRISSPSPAGFLVQCIQPFCPLFMAYSLIIVWAVFSPANIMESQTRLFFLMEGLLFSNFCVSVFCMQILCLFVCVYFMFTKCFCVCVCECVLYAKYFACLSVCLCLFYVY